MERLARTPSGALLTSSVCAMELRHGCALKGDGALWDRIRREVLERVEVVPFGEPEALRCGEVLEALARAGAPVGIEDAQIGATALVHRLALVTFNLRHFRRIPGLRSEDWRAPPRPTAVPR